MKVPLSLKTYGMKNIGLLPVTDEAKNRLNEFALQYKRFAKIYVEVVSFENDRIIVRVEQKEQVNGKQLSKNDLTERVKDMFKDEIPANWKLTVSAVDFDRKDIDTVSDEWINKKMDQFNLKAKHLVGYTGIDKATISLILSGEKQLTKWQKVAFYYFFKYQEMSKF